MTQITLATQFERTRQFHDAVIEHVSVLAPAEGARYLASFQCGLLSIEHAVSAAALIEIGHLSSAFALYRPQFESLVRGIWLLHAATDGWVEKLSSPLTVESAKQANEGVGGQPDEFDLLTVSWQKRKFRHHLFELVLVIP